MDALRSIKVVFTTVETRHRMTRIALWMVLMYAPVAAMLNCWDDIGKVFAFAWLIPTSFLLFREQVLVAADALGVAEPAVGFKAYALSMLYLLIPLIFSTITLTVTVFALREMLDPYGDDRWVIFAATPLFLFCMGIVLAWYGRLVTSIAMERGPELPDKTFPALFTKTPLSSLDNPLLLGIQWVLVAHVLLAFSAMVSDHMLPRSSELVYLLPTLMVIVLHAALPVFAASQEEELDLEAVTS